MNPLRLRCCALFALIAVPVVALATASPASVTQPGEELIYKVKYGFVRLGTVIVRTLRDGSDVKVVMTLDSDPHVPFLSLHEYSESIVDAAACTSRRFYGERRKSGGAVCTRFLYDPARRRAVCLRSETPSGRMLQNDTLANAPPYVEGPSMFLYGRAMSDSRTVLSVPTMIDGVLGRTRLDFTKGRQRVEIGAVDYEVRTRRYDGEADRTVSTGGMSGPFTTWVSDDDAAVPIRVEMGIAVGHITMELESWKRDGWQPPR